MAPALLALVTSCSGSTPDLGPTEAEVSAAELSRIAVVAARPPGWKIRELGKVEWPPEDMFMLFAVACKPDHLRRVAVDEHGDDVDAIVDYREWKVGRQPRCGGVAVEFDD